MLNLNDTELKTLVEKHCGAALKKGEKPCLRCEKKILQAKIICWQKDEMWRRFRAGYYSMSPEEQRNYERSRREGERYRSNKPLEETKIKEIRPAMDKASS